VWTKDGDRVFNSLCLLSRRERVGVREVSQPVCNAQKGYGEKRNGLLVDSWEVRHLQSLQPH
jgi:hypothetical protein